MQCFPFVASVVLCSVGSAVAGSPKGWFNTDTDVECDPFAITAALRSGGRSDSCKGRAGAMSDDAVDGKPTFVMRLSLPRSASGRSDTPRGPGAYDEGAAASSGEASGADRPLVSGGGGGVGDGGWLTTRAAELRHWTARGIDMAGAGLDMVTGGLAHGVVTVGGVARQSVEAASSSILQVRGGCVCAVCLCERDVKTYPLQCVCVCVLWPCCLTLPRIPLQETWRLRVLRHHSGLQSVSALSACGCRVDACGSREPSPALRCWFLGEVRARVVRG